MDSLSVTLAALADPTRRAILARLAEGEKSVGELAAPFKISQPAISKHLKVLEDAKLITRGRKGQVRPARLNASPLKEAASWIESYRVFWTDAFDNLDTHLKKLQKGDPHARKH